MSSHFRQNMDTIYLCSWKWAKNNNVFENIFIILRFTVIYCNVVHPSNGSWLQLRRKPLPTFVRTDETINVYDVQCVHSFFINSVSITTAKQQTCYCKLYNRRDGTDFATRSDVEIQCTADRKYTRNGQNVHFVTLG